jgi:hypothetical protein
MMVGSMAMAVLTHTVMNFCTPLRTTIFLVLYLIGVVLASVVLIIKYCVSLLSQVFSIRQVALLCVILFLYYFPVHLKF